MHPFVESYAQASASVSAVSDEDNGTGTSLKSRPASPTPGTSEAVPNDDPTARLVDSIQNLAAMGEEFDVRALPSLSGAEPRPPALDRYDVLAVVDPDAAVPKTPVDTGAMAKATTSAILAAAEAHLLAAGGGEEMSPSPTLPATDFPRVLPPMPTVPKPPATPSSAVEESLKLSPPQQSPLPAPAANLTPFGWTDEEEQLLAIFADPATVLPANPLTTPDQRLALAVRHQAEEEERDRLRRQPRGASGKVFVTEARRAVVNGHSQEAPGPGIGKSPDKKEKLRPPLHESPHAPQMDSSPRVGSQVGPAEPAAQAQAPDQSRSSGKKNKRGRGKKAEADEVGPADSDLALAVEADMAAPLLELFRLLDPELKGHVSGANFELALKAAGTQLSHAEVAEIMERFGMEVGGDDTVIGEPVKLTNTAPHTTRSLKSKGKGKGKGFLPGGGSLLGAIAMASENQPVTKPGDLSLSKGGASAESQVSSQGSLSPTGSALTQSEEGSRVADAAAGTGAASLFDRRINYEEFCLTGRMLQIRAGDQPVPPVDAWIAKQKHSISNASHLRKAVAKNILIRKIAGPGSRTLRVRKVSVPLLIGGEPPQGTEATWKSHVAWYQRRRLGAVSWLMRRGLEAVRHVRNQELTQGALVVCARRADAFVWLRRVTRHAIKHQDRKTRSLKWLKDRIARAREHRYRQEESQRLLETRVKKMWQGRRVDNMGHTRQSRIYAIQFHRNQAFNWLKRQAAVHRQHYDLVVEAATWLHGIGRRIATQRVLMDREQGLLEFRGRRSITVSKRRNKALCALGDTAAKAKTTWPERYATVLWLTAKAEAAQKHLDLKWQVHLELKQKSEQMLRFLQRGYYARTFLVEVGAAAVAHINAQDQAREFLAARTAASGAHAAQQATAFKELQKVAERTFRHLKNKEVAQRNLRGRIGLVKIHVVAVKQAKLELRQMVDEARLHEQLNNVAKADPKRLKELEAEIKAADKQKDKDCKGMDKDERLRLEMRQAFDIFDMDASGEIDQLEFSQLLRGGALIAIPRDQMDDVYHQIDKDHSGAVSFDEFWAWFHHESKKNHAKSTLTVAKIMGVRERAQRMLLKESPDLGNKVERVASVRIRTKAAEDDPSLLHGVLNEADIQRVRTLFAEADDDASGQIDQSEFIAMIKRMMKEDHEKPPSDKELKKAFSDADEDGGGAVDIDEMLGLYAKVKKGEVKGLGGGMFGLKLW